MNEFWPFVSGALIGGIGTFSVVVSWAKWVNKRLEKEYSEREEKASALLVKIKELTESAEYWAFIGSETEYKRTISTRDQLLEKYNRILYGRE